MQGRSDQLLAAACLAADEHRHTDGRDGADVLVELDHLVAADDGLVPGGQPALERLALAVQPSPAALVVAQDRTVQGEQFQRGQVVGGEPVAAAAVQVDTAEHPAAAGERRAHERAAAGRTVLAHAPAAVHHLLDQVLADLAALLARVEAPRQGVDQFVLVVDQGEEAALRPQEVHGRVEQPLLEGGLLVQGVQVPAQVAEPAERLRHLARRRLGRFRSLGRLFRGEQDRGRVGRGMGLVPVGKDRRGPLVGLVVDKGEGVLDDAEGRAVAQAQGIDLATVHPHGIGAAVVEEQVVAVLLPADGGVVAGDLGRGEDDVVVGFAADGHRGGEGHHPVLLAILADDQSGHGSLCAGEGLPMGDTGRVTAAGRGASIASAARFGDFFSGPRMAARCFACGQKRGLSGILARKTTRPQARSAHRRGGHHGNHQHPAGRVDR